MLQCSGTAGAAALVNRTGLGARLGQVVVRLSDGFKMSRGGTERVSLSPNLQSAPVDNKPSAKMYCDDTVVVRARGQRKETTQGIQYKP